MSETQDLKKEVILYYKVFGSLAVLTVITVAISNLKLGLFLAVFLALLVATTKASLVASFFMHLSHEKKVIYLVLILTVIFFTGMMGLIIGSYYSVPHGTRDLNMDYKTTVQPHSSHQNADAHGLAAEHPKAEEGHH
ncbi:MAG: cytochrome C oxidase subunit IV family protein [Candidatus Omnitrophota bacterium]